MPAGQTPLRWILVVACLAFLSGCSQPADEASAGGHGAASSSTEESVDARQARRNHPNHPSPWWDDVSRRADSWYRTPEGLNMAANILSWQADNGGWPALNTTRERFDGDLTRAGPWGTKGSLTGATVNEMRFLARGFRATGNGSYKAAVLKGLRFLLDAQQNTGGWPRAYPSGVSEYDHYATFNDDLIPEVMKLLREVASSVDFDFLGDRSRQRSARAFDRGVRFILRTQVLVNGTPTAWAGQYDPLTLEPRAARPFEPVAISSDGSASVVELLMSISEPDARVARAIRFAVEWFRGAGIEGVALERRAGDRRLVKQAGAPTLWARCYEIGTGRPVFAGSDGVVHYRLADLEPELRGGLDWYNRRGADVMAAYQRWTYARRWDGLPPTNTDETLVGYVSLPDPLQAGDGEPVDSVRDWESRRRPELLDLFAQHQFGVTPEDPIAAEFEIVERDAPGLGGLSRRTQARIRFPGHPAGPVIRVLLNEPAAAAGPRPTLLYLMFSPNTLMVNDEGIDEGMAWSAERRAPVPDRDATVVGTFDVGHFVRAGYAVATVYYGDIEPDFDHGGRYGVRSLFDDGDRSRGNAEWGAIGAWAWGLSRVLDYLQTEPGVDGARVAVAGASRLGKTALWATAQDPRFAMAIPLISGEGGASLSRRTYGETIADLVRPDRYDYWFAPRYADYAFAVDRLPVDGHLLLALIAPRPVLQIVGSTDTWSDPVGEWQAALAAAPVFELYGLKGLSGPFPPLDQLVGADSGFLVHSGGHNVLPVDYDAMTRFMDQHFGAPGQDAGAP